MNNNKKLLKMMTLAMLVALGVVISPILRVEGMCPMAHFINIVCSVLLGPWYSLLCALLIGVIRMTTMGIPPIALTGAIFGAFLSGVFYRASTFYWRFWARSSARESSALFCPTLLCPFYGEKKGFHFCSMFHPLYVER